MSDRGAVPRPGTAFVVIVVVAFVLVVLAGAAVWTVQRIRDRVRIVRTHSAVHTVAMAIASYGGSALRPGHLIAADGSLRPFGDIDGDGLVDGDPALIGGYLARLAPPGYRGVVRTTAAVGLPTDRWGQPLDAWHRPLRIAIAAAAYGSSGVGVWSDGPDGRTPIRSWAPP